MMPTRALPAAAGATRAGDASLVHADLLDWLRANRWLVENGFMPKFHAALGDPPYFLGSIVKRFGKEGSAAAKYGKDGSFTRLTRGFMGKSWDGFSDVWAYQDWVTEWGALMLSFMHPGALGMFFGGTRTYHRLAAGLEDAGWDVVDCIMYCFGSGFPKSHNQGGHGSSLKPAFEPVVIVRAPRGKATFADLQRDYGTGMYDIDGGRIEAEAGANLRGGAVSSKSDGWDRPWKHDLEQVAAAKARIGANSEKAESLGRWPANLILDSESAALMDAMSGESVSTASVRHNGEFKSVAKGAETAHDTFGHADSGGASRFFYTAKAASWERCAGLDERSSHPTLKPLSLTEYLCRLLLAPSHVAERRLLVPFAGVASEMIGARLAGWESVTGIEREAEYIPQGQARLDWWQQFTSYEQAQRAYGGEQERVELATNGQMPLFADVP